MKTRNTICLFTVTAMIAMALGGCEKTKRGPFDCYYEIHPWASDTCSFSWMGYNTIWQTLDYFAGHEYTLLSHYGDTVRFFGWSYINGGEDHTIYIGHRPDAFIQDWKPSWNQILLVGHEDHHFAPHPQYGACWVHWDDQFTQGNPWFVQTFDTLLEKKWYVTAIVRPVTPRISNPCLNYEPSFYMIKLDTIPDSI